MQEIPLIQWAQFHDRWLKGENLLVDQGRLCTRDLSREDLRHELLVDLGARLFRFGRNDIDMTSPGMFDSEITILGGSSKVRTPDRLGV